MAKSTAAAAADDSEIQVLETLVEDEPKPVEDISGNHLQVRHRMHRSAVRPFFCCGSEISLVSLVENAEKEESSTSDGKTIEVLNEDNKSDSQLIPKGKNTTSKCGDCNDNCNGCRRQTTTTRRKKGEKIQGNLNKSKKKSWSSKLRGRFPHAGRYSNHHGRGESSSAPEVSCCACPRETPCSSQNLLQAAGNPIFVDGCRIMWNSPLTLTANFDELYPTDDWDEVRRVARAREMRDGIDPAVQTQQNQSLSGAASASLLSQMFINHCSVTLPPYPLNSISLGRGYGVSNNNNNSDYEESHYGEVDFSVPLFSKVVHTQVDYMHCLVPDLSCITNCSFYWGVMDRYEAEKLLENKPEGTFLLRDSAQDEFLFSVSFRRYNRSLHARIEQWNHKFSFDSHDPAVYSTETVRGLIEHYKDPNCCMFFEPMLTQPLNRSFPFSLKQFCRATICDHIAYDHITSLPLPKALKEYLTYYHYKQKVRVRRLDMPN